MDRAATDHPPWRWPAWAALLAPFPGRLEYALRLAVICALTAMVALIYDTPDAALTVYVVFFLNRPDRLGSILGSVALVVIVTLLIGVLFLLANGILGRPVWLLTALAGLSLAVLFIGTASKLNPIAGILAMVLAYGMVKLGEVPQGELATRALFYAWLFVAIPASVSIAVNLVMGPAPRALVQAALAHRLSLAASLLRDPDAAACAAVEEALDEGDAELLARLHLSGMEKGATKADLAALRRAVGSSTLILALVAAMERDRDTWPDAEARMILAATLDRMAAILAEGGYPVAIELGALDAAIDRSGPRVAQGLRLLRDRIVAFAEAPGGAPAEAPEPAKARAGFLKPDAFSNPFYVQYAVKTTVAAVICYLIYALLDWPGIHTIMITCYIVSLGTMAETVQKLGLRLVGAAIGAVLGIAVMLWLIPDVTDFGVLMAVVFGGTLFAAWIGVGSPRIGYAGLQIAFAFLLCVLQGSGPGFDMVTVRDRLIGILLGNLVAFVVYTQAWPTSVATRIDTALAAALRQLRDVALAANAAGIAGPLAQARAGLAAIAGDLRLMLLEPAAIRPPDADIATRRQALDALQALQPALLVQSLSGTADAGAALRLDRLAAALAAAEPPHGPGADDAAPVVPAQGDPAIAGILDDLEALPWQGTATATLEPRHAAS